MPSLQDRQQFAAETAIRTFQFDDFGLGDVAAGLSDDPDAQEWVPVLAARVRAAVLAVVPSAVPGPEELRDASRWRPVDPQGRPREVDGG